MNWQIENYWNLLLLGLIPMLVFLLYRFQKWKKAKKEVFAEKEFHHILFDKSHFFGKLLPILYLLGFSFLILALIDFTSKEKEGVELNQKFSNILFLVDVSNSMNAQDVEPSRLEKAKEILKQSLYYLENEKVGVIVFAGDSRSIMPLTMDYSSVELYLENIYSDIIQRQGTDFLAAIQEAGKKLDKILGAKKVILISDGEDNEGHHNEAIREANKLGINIISIGVGTEQGAPIPDLYNYYQDYKRDEYGQIIITKREISALKSIAEKTNGKYIDGNSHNAVNELIKQIRNFDKITNKNTSYLLITHYHYQWFLGIALFIFLMIYLFNPKRNLEF
ncbi:MAG: VWA domain-containing protein [Flavobacteriaceae bacterium]|nr:VWA domain-containing protein [Flavobacteriaceae bacterium]